LLGSATSQGPDAFDDWLRAHQIDSRELTDEAAASLRRAFDAVQLAIDDARSSTMFGKPCPQGEQRHAIAIEDGDDLRLGLVIRRSKRGEIFILIPRGSEWDPHSSYHADGTYHHKSYGQVFKSNLPKRQPLGPSFKGTEHLGSIYGFGTAAPICHRDNFTSVTAIPSSILSGTRGCINIDLVEPEISPNSIHRDGKQIVLETTYRDGSPWIVIAVIAQPEIG
jgi:hypothetical protein